MRKRNRSGEYRVSQHSVWFTEEAKIAIKKLSVRDQDESSTYRELYGVLFMVKTFAARAANSSLLIQADNQSVYFIVKKARLMYSVYILCWLNCFGCALSTTYVWIWLGYPES